jgi:hypothetical protein
MENANQDGQARLDKYYKDRLEFNQEVCRLEQELKQFKAKRNKETIMPLLEFLEQRIPTHLRHKVLSRFSFTEEDSNERSSLLRLIEERTFASIGMVILRNIPMTKEEITELNQAWHPVAGISPDLKSFGLGGSELSRKINESFWKELMDARDKVYQKGDQ